MGPPALALNASQSGPMPTTASVRNVLDASLDSQQAAAATLNNQTAWQYREQVHVPAPSLTHPGPAGKVVTVCQMPPPQPSSTALVALISHQIFCDLIPTTKAAIALHVRKRQPARARQTMLRHSTLHFQLSWTATHAAVQCVPPSQRFLTATPAHALNVLRPQSTPKAAIASVRTAPNLQPFLTASLPQTTCNACWL